MFEVYLKSQLMCYNIKEYEENEIFHKLFEESKHLENTRESNYDEMVLFNQDSRAESFIDTNLMFDEKEKLKHVVSRVTSFMPNISMVNIELYCDGNYPRGISVLY